MEVTVLEDAHGPCPTPDFTESSFDGVGGSHLLTFFECRIAPAGKQLVEVVAQALDGFGVDVPPAVGETARGGAGGGQCGGVHHVVQTGLDGVVVGLAHLVEDVPDLVRPATLHGQAGIDDGQGGRGGRRRHRRRPSRGARPQAPGGKDRSETAPTGRRFRQDRARRKSMISFLPSDLGIPKATNTGRLSAPAPVLRESATPSSMSTGYWSFRGRRWKAATPRPGSWPPGSPCRR